MHSRYCTVGKEVDSGGEYSTVLDSYVLCFRVGRESFDIFGCLLFRYLQLLTECMEDNTVTKCTLLNEKDS